MRIKESQDALEIYTAEGVARLRSTNIITTPHSNLFISKEFKEALKFTSYETFENEKIVEIKISDNNKDIVELIDEATAELVNNGLDINEELDEFWWGE